MRNDRRQTPELPGLPQNGNHEKHEPSVFFASDIVNPRKRSYKGGRVLPYATRFRYWRTTEGKSITGIVADCENLIRGYGIAPEYLQTRLYELEQGRFKPPTWLFFLLVERYRLKFPWWEFLEVSQ